MGFPYATSEESRIQNRKTIIKVIKDTTIIRNGIEDVKTVEELTSKILPENEGKLYKYIGESCDEYEKFAIYQVCLKEGEATKLISDIHNSAEDIVLSIDNTLNDYRLSSLNVKSCNGPFEVLYTMTSDEDSIVPNLSVMQDYSNKFDTYNVDKIYFKTIQIPIRDQSSYTYTFKNRLCAYGNIGNLGETICLPLITSLSIADQFGFTISEDDIQSTEPGNVFSVERKPDGSIITNIEKKAVKSIDIYIDKYISNESSSNLDKFILVEENELLLGYQEELNDQYPTAPDFYSHIIYSCLNKSPLFGHGEVPGSGWYKANIPIVGKINYINPLIKDKNIFTAGGFDKPEYKLIKIK